MSNFFEFALIGIGIGALYALAAQGLVVIYRGSGVLNLAYGAIALSGAYVYAELRNGGTPTPVAIVCGVLFSALLGALAHILIMRHLRLASPLARVVATLGILVSLQSIAVLRYGGRVTYVGQFLPQHLFKLGNHVTITADRLILLGVACVMTVGLWWLYRRTPFGLATLAVAEDERAAASLGCSPDLIAVANWSLGSACGGFAAILIAPIVTLQIGVMTNLLLVSLAVALVANFGSFPGVLFAGLGLGVAQSVLASHTSSITGLSDSLPFFVIVAVLVVRGRSLPLRDYLLQRLPAVGTGRFRPALVALFIAICVALIGFTPLSWAVATTITLGTAIVVLSLVVLTGYTGQLSLAQFAFAGFGALVAGRLIANDHWSTVPAVVCGIAATVPVGLIFALPALRTRGITLAVVTLGLGSAMQSMVFNSGTLTGGAYGLNIAKISLFGWPIDAIGHARRYGFVVLAGFLAMAFVVGNIRRSATGRRLVAVRTNERAAASLGISVRRAKMIAFGIASAIAALGGIALSFNTITVVYNQGFDPFTSISAVGYAFIGGIGYIFGSAIGGQLAPNGLGTEISNLLPGTVGKYLSLAGGILLIVTVLANQDGIARQMGLQFAWFAQKILRVPAPGGAAVPLRVRADGTAAGEVASSERIKPRSLDIRDVSVRFGGTMALKDVSFTVTPGEVVGLIGPNGAGKTTLIDAVTGFAPQATGDVLLEGESIMRMQPHLRVHAGITRSFQGLELFEDSTVLDNLRSACDPSSWMSLVGDLVFRRSPPLPEHVAAVVQVFDLAHSLDVPAQALSFGHRHLLSIARAVAARPSVLLLDEPAAGLSDKETRDLALVVRRLARDWNIAVLLIEHDMNFVMGVCDTLVVLNFGEVIAIGDPGTIRADPTVLAAYLGDDEASLGAEPAATDATPNGGEPTYQPATPAAPQSLSPPGDN